MDTTRPSHPSAYAALRTTSSTGAVIGTTAPCSTGFARTGNRLLGKMPGIRELSAVPIVWICCWDGRPEAPGDAEVPGTTGGNVDCITLRDGLAESGGEGRNIRSGTLRNWLDGAGRRALWMR